MTAANTRRHKRRVAPGSGQNKRRRAAQSAQSHNTDSTSNSSSGGGPNDLGYTPPQLDTSQQESGTSTGMRRMTTRSMARRAVNQPGHQETSETRAAPENAGAEQAPSQESNDGRPIVAIVRPQRDSDAVDSTDTSGSAQPDASPVPMDIDDANTTTSALEPSTAHRSSPSKVSGTRIQTGSDFGVMARNTGIIVDKTLICKAFLKPARAPMCVCLPRRFGKTFNLSIIEEFLNVVNNSDAQPVDGQLDEQACRQARERLFEGTLLREGEPEFFDQYFCKYPVIRLGFKDVDGDSLGSFYKSFTNCLYVTATEWIKRTRGHQMQEMAAQLHSELLILVREYSTSLRLIPLDQWINHSYLASDMFAALTDFLLEHYSGDKYIVLLDEYDVPLAKMRGKSWSESAQGKYLLFLSEIFKNNSHLEAGLMVGVHSINLGRLSSGVNNIETFPLAADTDSEQIGPQPDEISEYFGYVNGEIRLLIQQARVSCGGRLGRGSPSDDDIFRKMSKWYNGYRIGSTPGKFNPFASVRFLDKLSHGRTLDDAAKSFWEDTGNNRIITAITLKNRGTIGDLASRLTREYDDPSLPASIVVSNGSQPSAATTSTQAARRIQLCRWSLPDDPNALLSGEQLVTLFLYTGYLTLRQSSALRIPDGELRRAWDDVLLTAIFNSDSGIVWANERKSMLDKLYAGDMRDIHQQFNHVMQHLSNVSGAIYEAISANLFRTFILLKMVLPLPHGDMDDYSGSNGMGPVSTNEGQSGDGCFDWRVMFPSCSPHRPKPLCVTFEFKRIGERSSQTSNHPLRKAQEGLEQIVDRRYAANISHAHRRLDVGVAIGMGTVAIRQRMWRTASKEERRAHARPRQNVRYAGRRGRTTVEEWDQQHIDSDNAGWVDEHGWITERISDEFRVRWLSSPGFL
ncbi:hypothetical protein GQ54DRAFT_299782 [Martensiomyces pterosporus]|nr:hypothetical protein GQ54DRAFT_299782 [Martensiomyces pterosporus]